MKMIAVLEPLPLSRIWGSLDYDKDILCLAKA